MKFALASDIHLEFGPIELKNTEGADVLVLAGDICVARKLQAHDDPMPTDANMEIHKFFQEACNEFPHVVYVMGNHEHYHFDFPYTLKTLKGYLSYLPNLHILEKETVTIKDVTFIGGTLWTDMNNKDEETLNVVAGLMNDFRCVTNSDRKVSFSTPEYALDENGQAKLDEKGYMIKVGQKFGERDAKFSTRDSVDQHVKMKEFIRMVADANDDKKIVVVGHHAPSKLSTHPKYARERVMNGAYSSDLNDFILDRPQIKAWVHGHTHEVFDYMIGGTRIVCNPRGYINYEVRADNFALQYIEV